LQRISNYGGLDVPDELRDQGIALASRFRRLVFDASVKAHMVGKEPEEASL
jgi:hypothetical protein